MKTKSKLITLATDVGSWNYTDKVMQKAYENGRLIKLPNRSASATYHFSNRVHAGVELKPRNDSGISVSVCLGLKKGNFLSSRTRSPIMVRN